MDKTQKFLRKLSFEQRTLLRQLVQMIEENNTAGLDIKRLQGHWNIYRARSGNFRIIFKKNDLGIEVLEITRRNEKTYK